MTVRQLLILIPTLIRRFLRSFASFGKGAPIFAMALAMPLAAQAKYASIVIDADSGQVFSAINADTRNYPASLTKMMTLYMLFDQLKAGKIKLTDQIKISKHAASQPPSKLGLKAGQTITVEQAILALCTKSANDVAAAVAERLGGTESAFATMMTNKARQLGMRQTTFRNASGLPNLGQYSTARDMATLSRALLRNHPGYYKYFSTRSFSFNGATHRSHNRLLEWYDGADGIKTGYIAASGFNLAASVKRGDRRLIGVVFGGESASSRDAHMGKILDEAFARAGVGKGQMMASAPATPQAAAPQRAGSGNYGAVERAMTIAQAEQTVVAKPQSQAAGDFGDDSGWGIQIGAFSRRATAEEVAQKAQSQLSDILAAGSAQSNPIEGQNITLYRARVVGISESVARDACRRLNNSNTDCRVVNISSQVVQR